MEQKNVRFEGKSDVCMRPCKGGPYKAQGGPCSADRRKTSSHAHDNINEDVYGRNETPMEKSGLHGLDQADTPRQICTNFIIYAKGDVDCFCGNYRGSKGALAKHIKGKHGGVEFVYKCETCPFEHANARSVAAHARYCEGPTVSGQAVVKRESRVKSGEVQCEFCDRTFTTVSGKGLHAKTAHPEQFNAESVACKRTNWPISELKVLAETEAALILAGASRNRVAQLVEALPHRPKAQIYTVRKKREYKALLEEASNRMVLEGLQEGDSIVGPMRDEDNSAASEESRGELNVTPDVVECWLREYLGCEQSVGPKKYAALSQLFGRFVERALGGQLEEGFSSLWAEWGNLVVAEQAARAKKSSRRNKKPAGPKRRVRKRELIFEATQQALNKNFRTTVGRMLDGTFDPLEQNNDLPAIQDVERLFRERLEGQVDSKLTTDEGKARGTEGALAINEPITAEEVLLALKKMKAKSACGPEGWQTVQCLKQTPAQGLAAVLNVFLWQKWLPKELKESRTVLIPKCPKAGTDASKYRPISITPALSRVYAKVVASRLQRLSPYDVRQKAFINEDGCFENLHTFRTVLDLSRKNRRELNVCCLDLAKAFDSVPHDVIFDVLQKKGFTRGTQEVVKSFYTGATTKFEVNREKSDTVRILRGVRQGCPLSPFLFNSVMDEVVAALNERRDFGVKVGSAHLVCMAFADDLILFGKTKWELQTLLNDIEAMMANRGLKFNSGKCASLRLCPVRGRKSMKVSTEPEFQMNGELIPCIGIDGFVRYLGLEISPEGRPKDVLAKAKEWVRNLQRYRLKPEQRLQIVKEIILGKLVFTLRVGGVNRKILESIDRLLRNVVKEALHIPPGTPNAYFHLGLKQGGAGLQQLRETMPLARLKALEKLRDSDDTLLREVYKLSVKEVENLTQMCATDGKAKDERFLGTEWGKDAEAVVKSQASYGSLLGSTLKGHELVRTCQLLSGNLPTRMAEHRGHTEDFLNVACRRCGMFKETAAHVLSNCGDIRKAYSKRHDRVKECLARFMEASGKTVYKELEYRQRGERFRPDLTVVTKEAVEIVEVSVPYACTADYLESRGAEKEAKYLRPGFLEAVKERFGGKRVTVRSVVVGARGEISGRTKTHLSSLDLWRRSDQIRRAAILGSLQVFDIFRAGVNPL